MNGDTVTPPADFNGTLKVLVSIDDGEMESLPFFIDVDIEAANDPPVITNETDGAELESVTVEVTTEKPFELALSANDVDGDSLSWSISNGPSNGNASVDPEGRVTYEPEYGFGGTDHFTVRVSDGIVTDTVDVEVLVESAVFSSTGILMVSIDPPLGGSLKVFEVDPQTGNISVNLMTCPDVCEMELPIGARITLAPEPARDRHFSYWRVNGGVPASAGLTLAIEEDARVTAVFGVDGIADEIPIAGRGNDPLAREGGGEDSESSGGGGCFMDSLMWRY